ncbi:hypothetical protein MNBD_GAMMA12-2609, partial [hydrothermal vent metagenome]
EIIAKENQVIVVEDENMEITVEGPGGMRVHIKNDALHIQSAKEIRIEGNGGGDITLHQSGGGVCVTAAGNVKLFGNDIQIEGDNGVSLNGTVSYTIGTGASPRPTPQPELQPTPFDPLKDAKAPEIIHLAWEYNTLYADESIKLMYMLNNVNAGDTAEIKVLLKTNDGNKHIDTLTQPVSSSTEHHTLNWLRKKEDVNTDQEATGDDITVLDYIFEVNLRDTGLTSDLSPITQLLPNKHIKPELVLRDIPDIDGIPLMYINWELTLNDEILEEGVTDENGKADITTPLKIGEIYLIYYNGTELEIEPQEKYIEPDNSDEVNC